MPVNRHLCLDADNAPGLMPDRMSLLSDSLQRLAQRVHCSGQPEAFAGPASDPLISGTTTRRHLAASFLVEPRLVASSSQVRRTKISEFLDAGRTATAFLDGASQPSKMTLGLAGGCYWGLQQRLDAVPGVLESHVGFMGGPPSEQPTYHSLEELNAGHPSHPWVETVQVTYENKPGVLKRLLDEFASFKDATNRGVRYSREVFGNSDQLNNVPDAAHAKSVPSSETVFHRSDRTFDDKYFGPLSEADTVDIANLGNEIAPAKAQGLAEDDKETFMKGLAYRKKVYDALDAFAASKA